MRSLHGHRFSEVLIVLCGSVVPLSASTIPLRPLPYYPPTRSVPLACSPVPCTPFSDFVVRRLVFS